MLPDNFLPSNLQLTSSITGLSQKHELFKEYNDMITKQQQEGIIESAKDSNVTLSDKTY